MGKERKSPKKGVMLRDNHINFSLNEDEYKALMKYCARYNIRSRSKFLRETVMKVVINRMTEDYPTLFHENEMR
ncbi:MAG: hypothetical protein PHQ26_06270 [Bacteroidales bacterium]|jgi:hypothetical protein|nr:hypothetical protein [Bacteroidales bacterium]MDD3166889.1 hypothetical protein [Bacteroidales bacterium]MDD4771064.1 hypothetical protein [Bacteroidales bacterium]